MIRTPKNASEGVTNASLTPADFPLCSAESRAAARVVLEGRRQGEIGDATVVIWTGLPDYFDSFGKSVVTPPDTVSYYRAEDGSIVEEIRRHWEGNGRHGVTICIWQAWPDGRMYRETESCFVSSLDQLRRLPHAEQGMSERLYRTAK